MEPQARVRPLEGAVKCVRFKQSCSGFVHRSAVLPEGTTVWNWRGTPRQLLGQGMFHVGRALKMILLSERAPLVVSIADRVPALLRYLLARVWHEAYLHPPSSRPRCLELLDGFSCFTAAFCLAKVFTWWAVGATSRTSPRLTAPNAASGARMSAKRAAVFAPSEDGLATSNTIGLSLLSV